MKQKTDTQKVGKIHPFQQKIILDKLESLRVKYNIMKYTNEKKASEWLEKEFEKIVR